MRNKEGYEKLKTLCENLDYENDWLELVNFITEFEKICYNDISSRSMDYFNDGWSRGSVTNLMKHMIKSVNGDKKATERIKVDLELENINFTIKKI